MKKILFVIVVFTSTAFAATPPIVPSVWCRAHNLAGTQWYYSAVFPKAEGKSDQSYAEDWKAWLDDQARRGELKGFHPDHDKISIAQCHVEPRGELIAHQQRDRDKATNQDVSHMSVAIDTQWDPRGNYMWCVSQPLVLDKKQIDTPQYTPVFEYDGKNHKSYYEAALIEYLNTKLGYKNVAVCHPYRDKTLAETDRKRSFDKDKEESRTPKEINWSGSK